MKIACVHAIADLAMAEPSDIVRAAYGGHGPELRPRVPDPQALRSASDGASGPGGGPAAMESGSRPGPSRIWTPIAQSLRHARLPHRHDHEAGLRSGARRRRSGWSLPRARRRRCSRSPSRRSSEGIARPDADRPPGGDRQPAERAGADASARAGFRPGRPLRERPTSRPTAQPSTSGSSGAAIPSTRSASISASRPDRAGRAWCAAGDADAMICGVVGRYAAAPEACRGHHRRAPGVRRLTAMNAVVLPARDRSSSPTPMCRTDPSAEDLAEITRLCAAEVARFGLEPKVALLSHSNFGSHDYARRRPRCTRPCACSSEQAPDLEVEGEMHANLALDAGDARRRASPDSRLTGRANLLIMPNQDAANIAFNLLRTLNEGGAIRPHAARRRPRRPYRHTQHLGARPAQHDGAGGGAGRLAVQSGSRACWCIELAIDTFEFVQVGIVRGESAQPTKVTLGAFHVTDISAILMDV